MLFRLLTANSDLINNYKGDNMKISNYILCLFTIVISSCSNNNNDSDQDTTQPASFEFRINGTAVDRTFTKAQKKAHTIHLGTDKNDTSFLISFDENGHFGKIVCTYTEPVGGQIKKFTSSTNASSNYFNFQLLSFDQENKRVKASFNGNVYRDPQNLNSETKFIDGSFDLPYEDYVPPVANIINEATINGSYWRATNQYQTRDVNGDFHNIVLHSLSDDSFKIMIYFYDQLANTTPPGTYSFSNSDLIKKVRIAKYNVSTATYTFYNCTGTLTITNAWDSCIQGTYSFTGVNPNDSSDIVTVENGYFKLGYDPYN
ncbi:MAG: hypothetical protein EOO46_14215 [Flavobacterium sp.]|nr:MAG: hypothetical protein EOO46_14215 [Flavobacterium sp.]